ncbi:MAG: hypothetical protein HPY60_11015 [Candidatus Methanofastidiosum sp.]|nr:hypothetical protein [Methanofastidiosum sp.]
MSEKHKLERYYYHPFGRIVENKLICGYCGKVVDSLFPSKVPCKPDIASVLKWKDYFIELNVGFFGKVGLLAYREKNGNRFDYHVVEGIDNETKVELERLMFKAVEEVGAINFTDIYPITDELMEFLEENIGTRIKLVKLVEKGERVEAGEGEL